MGLLSRDSLALPTVLSFPRQYLEIVDKCFRILDSVVPFEPKHPPVQESQASVTAAGEEKRVSFTVKTGTNPVVSDSAF